MAQDSVSVLEQEVDYELQYTNLTNRQLLAQNEIIIRNLRIELNALKKQKISGRNQQKIQTLLQKIQDLKIKNKLLHKNINQEVYQRSQKNAKESKKSATKGFVNRKLNLRYFESSFRQYVRKQIWVDVFNVFIGSLIITFAFDYFVLITGRYGLFPPGLGAIAREVSIVINLNNSNNQSSLYFLVYLGLNIPFVIFGFFKVGFKFSLLTLLGMVFQNIINLIITNLPFVNPGNLHFLINYNDLASGNGGGNGQPYYLLWLFLFGFISAILAGIGYSFLYRSGGSSAGIDFISGYYQKKYNISIASINIAINIGLTLMVLAINAATIKPVNLADYFNLKVNTVQSNLSLYKTEFFFGPTLFASFILVGLQGVVCNAVYPRFKYMTVRIYTTKGQHIIEALQFKGFATRLQLQSTNIYHMNEKFSGEEIILHCSVINLKNIKAAALVIDKNASFSAQYAKRVSREIVN